MSQPTRRGRNRVDTEREIRRHARELLIEHGSEAVTLRAIARGLGITAPALYRYYDSRAELLEQLRLDICADLGDHMSAQLDTVPETDTVEQLLTACRTFRRWSLDHPQEFVLVFASLTGRTDTHFTLDPEEWQRDRFGQVFLSVAGKLLAAHKITMPEDDVPAALRGDLAHFRDGLLVTIAETGVELTEDNLDISTAYLIVLFWARLYGQVALEVFGGFLYVPSAPDALFEATLAELMRNVGLN